MTWRERKAAIGQFVHDLTLAWSLGLPVGVFLGAVGIVAFDLSETAYVIVFVGVASIIALGLMIWRQWLDPLRRFMIIGVGGLSAGVFWGVCAFAVSHMALGLDEDLAAYFVALPVVIGVTLLLWWKLPTTPGFQ